MTFQALWLRSKIRHVQEKKDVKVWLDARNKQIVACVPANTEARKVDLSKHWDGISSTLTYLNNEGLVENLGIDYYRLTHSGYHYVQTAITGFSRFLVSSICVPIVVSLLTTLLSLWLYGLFGNVKPN